MNMNMTMTMTMTMIVTQVLYLDKFLNTFYTNIFFISISDNVNDSAETNVKDYIEIEAPHATTDGKILLL